MKKLRHIVLLVVLASISQATWPFDLSGKWVLKIENLDRKVVASMTLRFKDEAAPSCLGDSWRKLIVESPMTGDPSFFPVADALSYKVERGTVIIGRNEVCDAYLHLTAKLDKLPISGEYTRFGWTSERLGYFKLERAP